MLWRHSSLLKQVFGIMIYYPAMPAEDAFLLLTTCRMRKLDIDVRFALNQKGSDYSTMDTDI